VRHSLSVLSKLIKPFERYRGNNLRPDERTNVQTGHPKNIILSPILLDSESKKLTVTLKVALVKYKRSM